MRKLILTVLAGFALAAPAAAGSGSTLTVMMKDPGCHWFYVGGKYKLAVVRHAPVKLVNFDEAALVIKGPGGTRTEKVGGKLMLKAKGVYRITMVKQAADDNHLKLTIK